MIKKYLDNLRVSLGYETYEKVLEMVEQDIKFNRVGFNKITFPKEFITICERCKFALIGGDLNY